MTEELTYMIKESDLMKLHKYIQSQAAIQIERAFSLGKSELTNEEQAVLTSYKAQQIAVNTINMIERGDY